MCSCVDDNGPQAGPADRIGGAAEIGQYSERIAKEIHERVEVQREIVRQALSGGTERVPWPACLPAAGGSDVARMKAALMETIEVLEETKCSFKSRRLEVMRKKLIAVLAGD